MQKKTHAGFQANALCLTLPQSTTLYDIHIYVFFNSVLSEDRIMLEN